MFQSIGYDTQRILGRKTGKTVIEGLLPTVHRNAIEAHCKEQNAPDKENHL
jgi:hypothetical protein